MPERQISVIVYSRQGCHLCEVMFRMACRLQREIDFDLSKIDVAGDERLAAAYGHRVPVVVVDGREICCGAMPEGRLRKAVKKARWRSPISRILSRIKLTLIRG